MGGWLAACLVACVWGRELGALLLLSVATSVTPARIVYDGKERAGRGEVEGGTARCVRGGEGRGGGKPGAKRERDRK